MEPPSQPSQAAGNASADHKEDVARAESESAQSQDSQTAAE